MLVVHWKALNTVAMTLGAVLTFLCVCRKHAFNMTHTTNWFLHLFWPSCLNQLRLIDAAFMPHWLTLWIFISFIFGALFAQSGELMGVEGGDAFTHLLMHRRPLTAAYIQIFSPSCSPALNLTLVPSPPLCLAHPILAIQCSLSRVCISKRFTSF